MVGSNVSSANSSKSLVESLNKYSNEALASEVKLFPSMINSVTLDDLTAETTSQS